MNSTINVSVYIITLQVLDKLVLIYIVCQRSVNIWKLNWSLLHVALAAASSSAGLLAVCKQRVGSSAPPAGDDQTVTAAAKCFQSPIRADLQ